MVSHSYECYEWLSAGIGGSLGLAPALAIQD